jgi:hypothetical protein
MDSFQDLIEKRLREAKPLSRGTGLYRSRTHTSRLSESSLNLRPLLDRRDRAPIIELDDIAQDIHTLQQHTEEVEHHIRRRVWLGQLFDTVFVAGVFCLYPLSLLIFMPLANKLLLFTPSVLILFSILFFSLMTAYLWLFHYFQIPTLGMQFQYMTVWPEQWRWSRTKIFPAFGRAFGHLTLDSLRRDVSCDP